MEGTVPWQATVTNAISTPKDLQPRKQRQYTRKERWANWWDYNLKWVLLIGIAAAFVAYSFIGQYFFTTKPDYNVAVVAPLLPAG